MKTRQERTTARCLLASVVSAFLATTIAVRPLCAADAVAKDDTGMLVEIASRWLVDWDAANWAACFNASSPVAKGIGKFDQWSRNETRQQQILGKLISRKFNRVEDTFYRGEVVIVVFDTTFEHKGLCSEGVYLRKEPDGKWWYVRHLVKPPTQRWLNLPPPP
jgi:hypothetical protein